VTSEGIVTLRSGHPLLDEPQFSILAAGRIAGADLAEVLARLGAGEDVDFPALRPHQFHPWHAFLVQLGALVAARTDDRNLARPADAWRQALLDLAGDGGADAWTLIVPDTARPAFMQVPVPAGQWPRYKPAADTPDDLDMLVTAKNHDVKEHLMSAGRPEHWVYALVTLQTFQGYSGRGNYGVARMNSGFGNRPGLAAAPGLGWAERFARDVKVWLESRDELLGPGYEYADRGQPLLWTLDWSGEAPRLPMSDCDPFFVEVCRRVRLVEEDGGFAAHAAPSDSAFLDAKERLGDTGDVWTPVKVSADGAAALTVSPSGLTYRKLQEVLFGGDWQRQPALRVRRDDGPRPVVVAQVMVRGQGKTEGYHERRIPVPEKAGGWLRSAGDRARLGDFAKARVERVGDVQRRILKPALCALLQGAPEDLNLRDDRPLRWLDRLDREVDALFFDHLWRDFGLSSDDPETADRNWEQSLYDLARAQLDDAVRSAAVPEARDYRAVATAEMVFEGAARKILKKLEPRGAADEPTDT
jgi:CRISPR system Cascade subunit CasA